MVWVTSLGGILTQWEDKCEDHERKNCEMGNAKLGTLIPIAAVGWLPAIIPALYAYYLK